MNYLHGQLLTFTLRSLYRFGMSFADKEKAIDHLKVMSRHIEFLQECIEALPSITKPPGACS